MLAPFGPNFDDLLCPKTDKNENMNERKQQLCFLKENMCFQRSRTRSVGVFFLNNGVGTRSGIGSGLLVIFDGFGPLF